MLVVKGIVVEGRAKGEDQVLISKPGESLKEGPRPRTGQGPVRREINSTRIRTRSSTGVKRPQ